jgi:hypothetical protein
VIEKPIRVLYELKNEIIAPSNLQIFTEAKVYDEVKDEEDDHDFGAFLTKKQIKED